MACVIFRAATRWSGESTYCESIVRQFKTALDEPANLGGTDRAMNPVEMLLCALGGCLCISAVTFAKECGVDLKGVRVETEGDLDPRGFLGSAPDVRCGYQAIRYKLYLDSPSPRENLDRLISIIEARCPVSDTLKGVNVVTEVVIGQ